MIIVYGDCKPMIELMKKKDLATVPSKIMKTGYHLMGYKIDYKWISAEKNQFADYLSRITGETKKR